MAPTKARATPESIARGKRIREAANVWLREGPHRNTKQLIAIIGVSEPTWYNWKIAAVNLLNLCRETRFHPFYLLWGHKPKRILDNPVIESLLKELEDCDEDQIQQLLSYTKFLKSSPSAK